ncbi:hypothetical protein HMPREF9946_02209 [Acetobacteraceae bacterium AT-5844]|nr:hypothetical protein HMPREF9946_02209 [Acetobacteraceae bacterium AT-5844]
MLNTDQPERVFLVVLRPDKAFDPATAAGVVAMLKHRSNGNAELAFSSQDGSFIGIYVKARLAAAQIRAAVDERMTTKDRGFVLVTELGPDFAAIGNSSGWRHLQRLMRE